MIFFHLTLSFLLLKFLHSIVFASFLKGLDPLPRIMQNLIRHKPNLNYNQSSD